MSKVCTICDKKSTVNWTLVKLRGKYNPTCKKRKYPNLQWTRVPMGVKSPKGASAFAGQRILACTKCIKALGKGK